MFSFCLVFGSQCTFLVKMFDFSSFFTVNALESGDFKGLHVFQTSSNFKPFDHALHNKVLLSKVHPLTVHVPHNSINKLVMPKLQYDQLSKYVRIYATRVY